MSRVLLTVHKFFPGHKAGTEVLTLKVAQQLQARNYEVLVVTANPPDLDARHKNGPAVSEYVHEGVPVHVVEEALRLSDYSFKHEYYHPGIKKHFAGILQDFNPDLVHIFHAQNLSASIIEATREKQIPIVCSTTDFWFVCPIVQLKRPDGAVCRGPKNLASNCMTCYTPELFPPNQEITEALGKRLPQVGKALSALPEPLKNFVEQSLCGGYKALKLKGAVSATVERPAALRNLINQTDAVMVPTKLMHDIFVENGIAPELLHHVAFGIDTAPLIPYQHKSASPQVRIGYIGTLFEHKGVDLLIKAFQALPPESNCTLTIYGDTQQFPEYGQKLLDLAKEKPEGITFAGTFPNSRFGQVLSDLDVLVVPSRWYENTPLVIQSALATRTPVIATDLGGMSELIKHEVNGLLFRLNDHESLKNQLLRLDKRTDGLLENMRQNIPAERTISEMVDDIETIYQQVRSRKVARTTSCGASGSPVVGSGTGNLKGP